MRSTAQAKKSALVDDLIEIRRDILEAVSALPTSARNQVFLGTWSVKASHRLLLDYLRPIPAEEFTKDRGLRVEGRTVTIARLLQAEVGDERIHRRQIEEFKNRVLTAS